MGGGWYQDWRWLFLNTLVHTPPARRQAVRPRQSPPAHPPAHLQRIPPRVARPLGRGRAPQRTPSAPPAHPSARRQAVRPRQSPPAHTQRTARRHAPQRTPSAQHADTPARGGDGGPPRVAARGASYIGGTLSKNADSGNIPAKVIFVKDFCNPL